MTQEDLAARVNAGRDKISDLENGRETQAIGRLFDALAELGLELSTRKRAQ